MLRTHGPWRHREGRKRVSGGEDEEQTGSGGRSEPRTRMYNELGRDVTQASNQMVLSCKAYVDDICSQPLSVVETKVDECLRLHTDYRRQLRTLRQQLGDRRQFSEAIMFGTFDKFADRLRRIVEMLAVLQTYGRLRDSKIEGDLLSRCTARRVNYWYVCNFINYS